VHISALNRSFWRTRRSKDDKLNLSFIFAVLVHRSDHVQARHLPDSVLDFNGGLALSKLKFLLFVVCHSDVFVFSTVPGLEVPGDLGRRICFNWLVLKLEDFSGPSPNLVLVEVVPVDDGWELPLPCSSIGCGLAWPARACLVDRVNPEAVLLSLGQTSLLVELLWTV